MLLPQAFRCSDDVAGPRTAPSPAAGVASGVASGIATHGDRETNRTGRVNGANGTARPTNPLSGGIAAHGTRDPKPPKLRTTSDRRGPS